MILSRLRPVAGDGVEAFGDQFLDQLRARGLVLDQHDRGLEPLVLLAHRALQFGVFHAPAQDVDQVEVLARDAPARAHAEIAELGRLVGGVPALHDALEARRQLVGRIAPEPGRLDEAAAQRGGRLLVLAGEIVFADRAADMLEHATRLAFRVQGLAAAAGEMLRPEAACRPAGSRRPRRSPGSARPPTPPAPAHGRRDRLRAADA